MELLTGMFVYVIENKSINIQSMYVFLWLICKLAFQFESSSWNSNQDVYLLETTEVIFSGVHNFILETGLAVVYSKLLSLTIT